MEAFIAFDKYIVKEIKESGVGVTVSFNEEVAKSESCRRKNVQSYNQWMLIKIPESKIFLNIEKSLTEQTPEVISCLKTNDFLMTLFISEARKLFKDMDSFVKDTNDKTKKSKEVFNEFAMRKFEVISSLPSGLDLINFINDKCRTHDLSKSSALLYAAGIKGSLYNDKTGQRILLFNAAKDIETVETRSGIITNSRLVL